MRIDKATGGAILDPDEVEELNEMINQVKQLHDLMMMGLWTPNNKKIAS